MNKYEKMNDRQKSSKYWGKKYVFVEAFPQKLAKLIKFIKEQKGKLMQKLKIQNSLNNFSKRNVGIEIFWKSEFPQLD